MKRYEVQEIDPDRDFVASWGFYDNFPAAHAAFEALLEEHPPTAERGYAIRCNGQDVAVCPPQED